MPIHNWMSGLQGTLMSALKDAFVDRITCTKIVKVNRDVDTQF
jgi:hypothetical protein